MLNTREETQSEILLCAPCLLNNIFYAAILLHTSAHFLQASAQSSDVLISDV